MLEGKRVAVVVPAHEEERLIATTLGGIPGFVDRIIVVDDGSADETAERVRSFGDSRVELVVHDQNRGVGAAIVTGYKRALEEEIDVVCVMAGDNQMDPEDLEALARPVARGEVDYAKANRLFSGQAWELMPRTRYLGNAVLSMLTKIASGYWHIADSQSGYTAIGKDTLALLDLDRVYTYYGFPNDLLVHLNVVNARVRDFASRPVYGVGSAPASATTRSHRVSWLLIKAFFWRLREVHHPRLPPARLLLRVRLHRDARGPRARHRRDRVSDRRKRGERRHRRAHRAAADLQSQFTLFAMWFDMESNKDCARPMRRSAVRDLAIVLGCSWLVRAAVIATVAASRSLGRSRQLDAGRAALREGRTRM